MIDRSNDNIGRHEEQFPAASGVAFSAARDQIKYGSGPYFTDAASGVAFSAARDSVLASCREERS